MYDDPTVEDYIRSTSEAFGLDPEAVMESYQETMRRNERMADNLNANPARPDPLDLPLQARIQVAEYANNHFEVTDGTNITVDQCYVVWFAFVLGGWKALVSTTLPDGKYYEVTYNKPKGETYIDVYVKVDNKAVPD